MPAPSANDRPPARRGPSPWVRGLRSAVVLGLAAACGLPEPAPLARVAGAAPVGPGVPPEVEAASVAFTGPVSPDGLVDGRRLVLVPSAILHEALAAVESEAGAAGLAEAVPAKLTLEDGRRRAVLRLAAPLRARTGYALVLSSRARDEEGRPVLDAEGRIRPSVLEFETGVAAGPPPRAVLTEARADAATPEAGGEYVEIANRGEGPLDLYGHRLAKRTASGAVSSCVLSEGVVAPGGVALAVGGAYDQRYALPAGTVLVSCGATALLGGLANDRGPEVLLLDATGEPIATFGAGGSAPVCAEAAVRIDVDGEDTAGNLVCAEGSPGRL